MTDLGFENGWQKVPEPVKEAKAKGYELVETKIGGNISEYVCKELDFSSGLIQAIRLWDRQFQFLNIFRRVSVPMNGTRSALASLRGRG